MSPSSGLRPDELLAPAREALGFEAPARRAGTPAGARRDGAAFEQEFDRLARELADRIAGAGARRRDLAVGARASAELRVGARRLLLPLGSAPGGLPAAPDELREICTAVLDASGTLADCDDAEALELAAGTTHRYDRIVARLAGERLLERVLVEAKSAKGSGGRLEGNAHERLAFGAFLAAEAHRREPELAFASLANDAFRRYRSKYPAGFALIRRRLVELDPSFRWYALETPERLARWASELAGWLWGGPEPQT